ncbi:unnamed protein product [Rotaria sordida]|uniref:G-protein coupled receptors family 1 profile domain-containing protein n=1 Tax=Rotaria sordida TaxID=392033 RepID=A0A815CMB4_9BILA|nr:unnamed protein product [Rotaria sordida]CAF1285675.1 unnamed protein product [Rotaria sordida]
MNASIFALLIFNNSPQGPPLSASPITVIQSNIALFGYALLFILGLFGHTNSFLIFLRPILNHISTNCLFIALTISDSIYFLLSFYDFINIDLQTRDTSVNRSAMC